MTKQKHVEVLIGGQGTPREVSEQTAGCIVKALGGLGYRVGILEVNKDLAVKLLQLRPDVVMSTLQCGRERSYVQGFLEVLGIPHTNSGVLASSIALNKPLARAAFQAAGLPIPEGVVASLQDAQAADLLPRPYVIKPSEGIGSLGMHFVFDNDPRPNVDQHLTQWSRRNEVVVERFIPGRDLTVGVLGGKALAVMECRSSKGFLDAECRSTPGGYESMVPAPIPNAIYQQAMSLAEQAHYALHCSGPTRVDFRYDDTQKKPGDDGKLYVLEINCFPGFSDISPYPAIAAAAGWTFVDLVAEIVRLASVDL